MNLIYVTSQKLAILLALEYFYEALCPIECLYYGLVGFSIHFFADHAHYIIKKHELRTQSTIFLKSIVSF